MISLAVEGKQLLGTLFIGLLLYDGVVGEISGNLTDFQIEQMLRKVNKEAVRSIKLEDGNILDCIDIYKQPAFDSPLLQNHTIEMRPSFFPKFVEYNSSSEEMSRPAWRKNSCPRGTIPIKRIQKDDVRLASSLGLDGVPGPEPLLCKIEVAGAVARDVVPYRGVAALINVWNLLVRDDEWSVNVVAASNRYTLIEAGWAVSKVLFGDNKPHIFVNWRVDDNKGCFNLRCPGFVQVSRKYVVGDILSPVSESDGIQYSIDTAIFKDDAQQKWWLTIAGENIGYWPTSLVPDLQDHATKIEWVGRVCNTEVQGYHTTTQMGSGRFSNLGFGKSAFFKQMQEMTNKRRFVELLIFDLITSYKHCYDVTVWHPKTQKPGIFYGGPGGLCCDGRC